MIVLNDVSYRYPGATSPALSHVSLQIESGEFVLIGGRSGSGKSTLLRTLNGLVPHLNGGSFAGSVVVNGYDTRDYGPRVLSRVCGFVFQDPDSQAVAETVGEEIAFSLEQMGVPLPTMRIRVEEMLDLLGISHLRGRRVTTLSGGERQRVAVAGAMALQPRVLVLDEPISQLDPWGADDLLHAVYRLNQDLGITVVVAEHRLDRFLPVADRLIWMEEGSLVINDQPARAIELVPVSALPPAAQLARQIDCRPIPRSIKEARAVLGSWQPAVAPVPVTRPARDVALVLSGVSVQKGTRTVLANVHLSARFGEILVIMGRNGSGKTTLLRTILGFERLDSGNVLVLGNDMSTTPPQNLGKRTAYLPQRSGSVLFNESVAAELEFTSRHRSTSSSRDELVGLLNLDDLLVADPRDLSEGQRLRAALAAVLVGDPALIILDEPTRGLDGAMKEHLVLLIRSARDRGACVVLSTHDVELAAQVADRIVLLGHGEVVADDEPHAVLGGTLAFSTQMRRLFGPGYLTLEDVGVSFASSVSDTVAGAESWPRTSEGITSGTA